MNSEVSSLWMTSAVVIGLAVGAALAMQPSFNGYLGRYVHHPIQAAFISFATATVLITVISLAVGAFPPRMTVSPSELPWWAWCGGVLGVLVVTTSLTVVPRLGSLPWIAAMMTGQTIMAIVLDHFGMFGNPRSPASPLRLLGAGLLIAGVLIVVQAKRLEIANEPNVDSPTESTKDTAPPGFSDTPG